MSPWSSAGDLALRTVCEINPRYTMGRLALELGKRVAAGHWVRFSIERGSPTETAPPPVLDSRGRICEGRVVLNEDGNWRGKTKIEYLSWDGATRDYEVTNHRIALVDLNTDPAKPQIPN